MVNNISKAQTQQLHNLLRERLQSGASATIRVTSNSMWPLLSAGDDVILAYTAVEQLQMGDVITVITDGGLLTHRFWGFVPNQLPAYLLTKGDQPRAFDPPTAVSDLLGRVVARQHNGRVLTLDDGWGRWLNRCLSQLAAWTTSPQLGNLKGGSKVNRLQKIGHSVIQTRSIHKGVYIVAAGLTAVVHTLATTPISPNH